MLVNVKVKANREKFNVEKKTENNWIVSVTSKPKDNQANLELIKEFKKQGFNVRILRGSKSREKVLELL